MRMSKHRWTSAFGMSLVCHAAALGVITGVMILFPPTLPDRAPIEVDLVTMSGGGGGGGGNSAPENLPKIKEAEATPTAPPPPPPPAETEPDAEAENDVHEIADTPVKEAEASAPQTGSRESTSDGGSGGGTGGGTGTGNGTGTGSGEGSGSGSGSGGGEGSGTGDGVGDGEGSGETLGPQVLSAPSPHYPESCRKAGIQGVTIVGLTISSDGTVSSAWVAGSSGNGTLDQAAVDAVYRWQFVPAKQNGVAITCNSQVPITFELN